MNIENMSIAKYLTWKNVSLAGGTVIFIFTTGYYFGDFRSERKLQDAEFKATKAADRAEKAELALKDFQAKFKAQSPELPSSQSLQKVTEQSNTSIQPKKSKVKTVSLIEESKSKRRQAIEADIERAETELSNAKSRINGFTLVDEKRFQKVLDGLYEERRKLY